MMKVLKRAAPPMPAAVKQSRKQTSERGPSAPSPQPVAPGGAEHAAAAPRLVRQHPPASTLRPSSNLQRKNVASAGDVSDVVVLDEDGKEEVNDGWSSEDDLTEKVEASDAMVELKRSILFGRAQGVTATGGLKSRGTTVDDEKGDSAHVGKIETLDESTLNKDEKLDIEKDLMVKKECSDATKSANCDNLTRGENATRDVKNSPTDEKVSDGRLSREGSNCGEKGVFPKAETLADGSGEKGVFPKAEKIADGSGEKAVFPKAEKLADGSLDTESCTAKEQSSESKNSSKEFPFSMISPKSECDAQGNTTDGEKSLVGGGPTEPVHVPITGTVDLDEPVGELSAPSAAPPDVENPSTDPPSNDNQESSVKREEQCQKAASSVGSASGSCAPSASPASERATGSRSASPGSTSSLGAAPVAGPSSVSPNDGTDSNHRRNNITEKQHPHGDGSPLNCSKDAEAAPLLLGDAQLECAGCHTRFRQSTDLAHHMAVPGLLLRAWCAPCERTLHFANRCALLSHFPTAHGLDARTSLDLRRVRVRPSAGPDGAPCPVCHLPVRPGARLASAHFGSAASRVPQEPALACQVCALPCPSPCFREAHESTHRGRHGSGPRVCPECARVFPRPARTGAEFERHVSDECLHRARAVLWRCQPCRAVLPLDRLCDHVLKRHSNMFYKCDLCPTAFKTMDPVLAHFRQEHPGAAPTPRYKLIRRCPICSMLWKDSEPAREHVKEHLLAAQGLAQAGPYVRTYGFVCYECQEAFTGADRLRAHRAASHGVTAD